jgi:hypothetical protein
MNLMPEVEYEEEEIPREEEIKMDLEDVNEETGEENPNFVYEVEGEGEEDENGNILPVIEKKERQYKKEDIFIKANQPEPKKPPKKKRVLSDEHKQKLAQAREKALATRRANAQEKKRLKELEKKAKQKKTKELEAYVEDKPPVVEQVKEKVVDTEPRITKKDIEEAQLDAIMKYESMRKARKKKKQEEQEEEKKKEETRNAIRRATQPRNIIHGQDGFWDDMF